MVEGEESKLPLVGAQENQPASTSSEPVPNLAAIEQRSPDASVAQSSLEPSAFEEIKETSYAHSKAANYRHAFFKSMKVVRVLQETETNYRDNTLLNGKPKSVFGLQLKDHEPLEI